MDTKSPSLAVIEEVAEYEGVDPVELEPSLGDVIDTDALDALFQGGGQGHVTFEYCGYEVTVDSECEVKVRAMPRID